MNYTKEQLIETFDLPQNYTLQELNEKLEDMTEALMDKYDKKKVDLFIEQAKQKLLPQVKTEDLLPKSQDTFLTTPKETTFIYTQPSNYFKGDLNPLEKRFITRGVCIDTLFRPNYFNSSSTDFVYEFPENYKNIVSMKISAIEIPITWYSFSTQKKNNTFKINLTTVVIPDGNYTNATITAFMNQPGILPPLIVFSIDPATTKSSFSAPFSFTLDFSVGSLSIFQTAGWNLGFRKSTYTGSIITSESSWGSSFDNYFFIEIDDFQRNFISDSIVSVTNSGYVGKNIIARIPISNSYNTIMTSNDSDALFKTREYLGPVRLEKLHIRLLNRFGMVIDLNQNDYSIMIELTQLFS